MLSDSAFAASLLAIFSERKNEPMSDEEYAQKLAVCINNNVRTATVDPGIATEMGGVTVDRGTIS